MSLRRSIVRRDTGSGLTAKMLGSMEAGGDVTISVTPSLANFTVQLLRDGVDVAGFTANSADGSPVNLTLPDPLDPGNYTVRINGNLAGLVSNSRPVVLTAAPSISASDSLSGRTLTISVDSLTGEPVPSAALTTLTLDGADVSGDATGSGPWSYVVPDSVAAQTVAWEVTATNSEGSDAASGSEIVAANIVAPTFAVPNRSVVTGVGPFTLDLATFVSDNGGDASITYGLTPQAGVSLAGSVLTFADSVGTYSGVAVSATNAGGTANDTFDFEVTSAATAPAQFGSGDWSVASGDQQAVVTITALPANGGAAITAIEYQLDGGAWQDSGRITTGAFTITGLTNLTEYQVALRAVNAVGNGTASTTKAVTPAEGTMSLAYGGDGTPTVGLVDGSDVTIDIDGTPHVVAVADLDDGFELLTPCTASGTNGVGNVWTAEPGIYAYDPAKGAPILSYQWMREGIDIPGEIGKTYTQVAGDDTSGLKVKIFFTNADQTLGPFEADAIVLTGAVVSGYTGTMVETEDASYFYKTLETDGVLTFSAGGEVDIEGIGGGGGGGQDRGGGGGAGARVVITDAVVTASSYLVEVGDGGVGGVDGASVPTSGGTTTFDAGGIDLSAPGGGHGGANDAAPNGVQPANGGCGGGCGRVQATPGTGSVGGDGGNTAENDAGGGGGGMGGNGADASAGPTAGAGGAGVTGFLGDTVCEGGDGGNLTNAFDPTAPTDAGCGGGGGNRNGVAGTRHGANGAPGRVVIRIAK